MSLLVEKGWQYIRETFIRAKKTDRPAVNPPRERFLLRTYVSFFESKRKRGRKRAEAIPTNKNRSDRLRRASEESDTRASPSSASRAFSVPRVSRVSLPLSHVGTIFKVTRQNDEGRVVAGVRWSYL